MPVNRFSCFTHWLVSASSFPWGKEFLVNIGACLGGMWQRNREHFIIKIHLQFEDIWKMFMVTYYTSLWNHFLKSLSKWKHFFIFWCWNATSIRLPWPQAFCGSSEPSRKPQKQTQKEQYPIRDSVSLFNSSLYFKVLLWMVTIAPFTFIKASHHTI